MIKFTHEVEKNKCISFLDVKVKKHDRGFETGLFRKQTFTGLSTKYDSALPNRYEFNLIQCLVTRAFRIISDMNSFNKEILFLKKYFFQNKFPSTYVENIINKTISSISSPSVSVQSAEKKSLYCTIPFISHNMNSAMKRTCAKLSKRTILSLT